MSTLAITQSGDLALTYNARGQGNLALVSDPVVAGLIKLRNRFVFFLGEWFLDTRIGTPWFQYVLVKNPDLAVVRRMIRAVIESCPVIASCDSVDLSYNPSARTLSFTFAATANDGRTVTGGSGVPFIVDGKALGAPSATGNTSNGAG